MRRIVTVNGKRGGFGALIPTFQAIEQHPDMELKLVVTDQHLLEQFGNTVAEVEKWFDVAYKVPLEQDDDRPVSRVAAIGRAVERLGQVLEEIAPDLLFVIGDRGEILAATVAAINLGIPIAHVQGGDISGCVDEFVRHAITKMSHIHFPSTELSAERIRRMGEEDWRVHVVGDCHLDTIARGGYTPAAQLAQRYELDLEKPIILVVQHPVTTEPSRSEEQMRETCAALTHFGLQTVIAYPCTDAGYQGTISAIEELRGQQWVRIRQNIECEDFWGLEAIASVFVGNSSAGLIETPMLKLPSVTIGSRQKGRERAANCIEVSHGRNEIISAMDVCLNDEAFRQRAANCTNPYGDGTAWRKMADVLASVALDDRLFNKRTVFEGLQ